jgi:energy-coupling factor transport system permease protein
MSGDINAVAWTLWFVAVVVLPLTSRNPLYLALLLAVVLVVFFTLPRKAGQTSAWRLFAYIGSGVAALSIAFNVLTVHVGDRVFATLPHWLPIIGGPLTLNALLYGVISAMAISAVLFAAATFNTAVRHADLVRLLPGTLSRFGVAAGIAVLFVPQTISAARDIYDAQRARGHYFRGVRDARAFVVPLLSTGLERALLLSEALETRGFGSSAVAVQRSTWAGLSMFAAGISLIVALGAVGFGYYAIAMTTLVTAGVLAIYGSPSGNGRTRFRTTTWNVPSLVIGVVSALSIAVLLFGRAFVDLHLRYDTFPRIDPPGFATIAGAAIVCLIAPALVKPS